MERLNRSSDTETVTYTGTSDDGSSVEIVVRKDTDALRYSFTIAIPTAGSSYRSWQALTEEIETGATITDI